MRRFAFESEALSLKTEGVPFRKIGILFVLIKFRGKNVIFAGIKRIFYRYFWVLEMQTNNKKSQVIEKLFKHCKQRNDFVFHNNLVKDFAKKVGFGNKINHKHNG